MKATITYKVANIEYPWNSERRGNGEKAWCLIKVTTPELGRVLEEPVAMFNVDSEATMFQGHIYTSGAKELIGIDPNIEELCGKKLLVT